MNDKLKLLSEKAKSLEKNLFKDLEIKCLGDKIHTGVDVELVVKGVDLCLIYKVSTLSWMINGEMDVGIIKMIYCGQKTELNEKDEIREYETVINYPIRDITFNLKRLTIKSDNTSLGTKLLYNGKDMCKELSISEMNLEIGDCDTINKLKLVVC